MILEITLKYWIEILFGVICSIFGFVIKLFFKKIKDLYEKQKAIENGVQALLKTKLISKYNECMLKHEITIVEREDINNMYNEYVNLGGNGTVKHLIQEILNLPTKGE